ncbi:MAG: hydrolase [Proteobacteria bacterium]|nr:MAG: hydrolase [Pseudomonadota bacterium]
MPTVLTHGVAAAAIGAAILPRRTGWRTWSAGIACAMLPDVDVIAFGIGIPYSAMLGHRGLSHSIFFAAILTMLAAFALRGRTPPNARLRVWQFLFAASLSHGILDAFTNGGLGIAFFGPFSSERYFFSVRPIEVSPIGAGFFSRRGLDVLKSEMLWVWLPAAALVVVSLAYRDGKRTRQ